MFVEVILFNFFITLTMFQRVDVCMKAEVMKSSLKFIRKTVKWQIFYHIQIY